MNIFQEEDEEVKIDIFRHSSDMQAKRIQYVQDYRKNRNKEPVQRALDKIYNLTRKKPEVNFMEAIMEAVDARATIQEICDVMRRASNFDIPE